MKALAAGLLALMLVLGTPARAESEAQVRRDCSADALRHCALAIPRGRAAIIACMLKHRARLSEACKRHLY